MMMMMRFVVLLLAIIAILLYTASARPPNRSIQMINESGSSFEVYWIHPTTRELSLMSSSPVVPGASFPLQTFVGHEFEMRETGECKSQTCRMATFAISENDEQGTTETSHFHGETSFVLYCSFVPHHESYLTHYFFIIQSILYSCTFG